MLSFAIPGTVIGVTYVIAFNVPPIELTGTGIILVLSFIFRNMPVGVRAGVASMAQIDRSLDESLADARRQLLATLRRVVLPLLRPAILAALVYSFVRAMTAISAVIFLVSAQLRHGDQLHRRPRREQRVRRRHRLLDGADPRHAGGHRPDAARSSAAATSAGAAPAARASPACAPTCAAAGRGASQEPADGRIAARPPRSTSSTSPRSIRRHHARRRRRLASTIEAGKLVTLLGPSGCGKTTTLRMIAGLEMPTAGRILIGGDDVTRLPATDRDVVDGVPVLRAVPAHDGARERRLRPALLRLATSARRAGRADDGAGARRPRPASATRLPSELSGGQQQRVAVARALVLEPQVLLFDEPLSNLDAKLRRRVREEIRELQQKLGLTVVYVTHDQEEALAVSDRIIVMNNAVIAQEGTPRELYDAPADRLRRRLHRRGQHLRRARSSRSTAPPPRSASAR